MKKILLKVSKNKCMVGKFFKEFFMFLMNGERSCRLELFMRDCFERNGSAQNGSKRSFKREAYPYLCGTVTYRTVPKSRVNAASMVTPGVFVSIFKKMNCLNWLQRQVKTYS